MFDLENLNPGTKFTHEDGWSVWLRMLSGSAFADQKKQTVKKHREFKDGHIYEYDEPNERKSNELTWDYCILKWDIKDQNENQIACTKENKIKLMGESAMFSIFIGKSLKGLADDTVKKNKALEKN